MNVIDRIQTYKDEFVGTDEHEDNLGSAQSSSPCSSAQDCDEVLSWGAASIHFFTDSVRAKVYALDPPFLSVIGAGDRYDNVRAVFSHRDGEVINTLCMNRISVFPAKHEFLSFCEDI